MSLAIQTSSLASATLLLQGHILTEDNLARLFSKTKVRPDLHGLTSCGEIYLVLVLIYLYLEELTQDLSRC